LKPYEIRQNRVFGLTKLAQRGATVNQLFERMDQMKISEATKKSYYKEVVERVNKCRK